jgi:hypothetical protein
MTIRGAKIGDVTSFHWKKIFLDAIGKEHTQKHPFDFYMSYEGLSLTLQKGKLEKNENLQLGFAKKIGNRAV